MSYLVRVLVGVLFFSASAAFAQQQTKVWRLAWLSPADGPGPNHKAFLEQLKKLGYEEGRNLRIEWAWVGKNADQLPQAAIKLVEGKPDVLITQSQLAAQAAQKATRTIPTVFVGIRDPIVAGVVTSLARPGGNITGFTLTPNAELATKHIELLKEIIPKASRLAIFWNPDVPIQADVVETMKATGSKFGYSVKAFPVHLPGDIERAFEVMRRERIDGVLTLVEWFTYGQRELLARQAIDSRIVTLFEVKDYVKAGGLLAYGVIYQEHFEQAAIYVDKIIRGAKPGDLPVQQPARLEMVVNLKTAKALGIKIPESVLIRADEFIE